MADAGTRRSVGTTSSSDATGTRRASLRNSTILKSSNSTSDIPSKQDGPDMRPPKHDSNGQRSRNPPSRPTKSGPATKSSGTGSTLKGSSKRKRVKDEDEPTKTSPERTKLRREGKGATAGDQRSRSSDQETSGAASSSRAVTSGKAHSGGGRHAHIGEKLQPGDGQRDYELSKPLLTPSTDIEQMLTALGTMSHAAEPEPWRDDESCLHFDDQPTFLPTLSPEEIIRQGSFCGGYFRPIKSKKSGRFYKNDWKDLPAEWYAGLDLGTHLTHPDPPIPSLNRWKTKVGQSYEAWEDQGWIEPEHDCRGWFQWYCRFFRGRRCTDDDRQIGRWERLAGEKGGRWRRIYYGKYHKAGANEIEPAEETISKGIRQTLNHWAYEPSTDHLMRYLEEKGEDVANDEGDLAQ
ncbi:BZ3500_MvSof-1268-A1-R1_Chr2-3g05329 [Microbotryum saponariae]|uniref:BZ3500_MvSof-1268-A1-R1_Chr2-3g05329 protein n=1 Tax=Microbotryum saponariae TaxID=289078 RepID=A0A2X0L949_9BASI|nr:BZ3500_MvSof-1268-A1-R1_Chr2-3g05329 [Microbotryum saponariae]SDA01208.1 BZ3501_MvSof-1269-A2-R1_Chr2-2g05002 [Microbotryum saponariae]